VRPPAAWPREPFKVTRRREYDPARFVDDELVPLPPDADARNREGRLRRAVATAVIGGTEDAGAAMTLYGRRGCGRLPG
jgi:hypothetical protein